MDLLYPPTKRGTKKLLRDFSKSRERRCFYCGGVIRYDDVPVRLDNGEIAHEECISKHT